MSSYAFEGYITSESGIKIEFTLSKGIIVLDLYPESGVNTDQKNVRLSGFTKEGREIHLLIDYFWKSYSSCFVYDGKGGPLVPKTLGAVSACAVVEPGFFNDIDSLGFFSNEIGRITGRQFVSIHNDHKDNSWPITESLSSYKNNGKEYCLSIGFVETDPYYEGQLLELKSKENFTIYTMMQSYNVIKRLFCFLYQKRNAPLENVFLRKKGKNIGLLFVESPEPSKPFSKRTKCLSIMDWGDKLGALLERLGNRDIYLRHIPICEHEDNSVTPGRLLVSLIGLESCFDSLDACESPLNKKRSKKDFFKNRISKAIKDNEKEISNFFDLKSLGEDIDSISEDIKEARNKLAHGDLKTFDLSIKNAYQMQFSAFFIMYLQLLMIGFNKEEASMKVSQFINSRNF